MVYQGQKKHLHVKIAILTPDGNIQDILKKIQESPLWETAHPARIQHLFPEPAAWIKGVDADSANLESLTMACDNRMKQGPLASLQWKLEKRRVTVRKKPAGKPKYKEADDTIIMYAVHIMANPEQKLAVIEGFVKDTFPSWESKKKSVLCLGASAVPCLNATDSAPSDQDLAYHTKCQSDHLRWTHRGSDKLDAQVMTSTTNLIKNLDSRISGCQMHPAGNYHGSHTCQRHPPQASALLSGRSYGNGSQTCNLHIRGKRFGYMPTNYQCFAVGARTHVQ